MRVLAWANGLGDVRDLDGPLEAAFATAFAGGGGPVLALHPDAPRLTAELAQAALADLAAGADLAIGPGLSGGWYLLALAAPRPALFDGTWESRGAIERRLARRAGRSRSRASLRPSACWRPSATGARPPRAVDPPSTPDEILAAMTLSGTMAA